MRAWLFWTGEVGYCGGVSETPLVNVVFEDDRLLVVNKPADLVCHPSKNGPLSSLVGRVRAYLGRDEAFMVNRLDRETSGLMLIAKDAAMAAQLHRAFLKKQVLKEYVAIVHGRVAAERGLVDAPIGLARGREVAIRRGVEADGQHAQTEWWVEERAERFTMLRMRLHTGRAHQIRVHLAHIGHPVVGDKIYGGDERLYLKFIETGVTPALLEKLLLPRQALHAARLALPYGRPAPVEWLAPLPEDMARFWRSVTVS
ncbi:MAG: RluA family pseudouridine synthase [Verrucomicrobia bacterium]|nr:RluA family pseudouridine synthase [Verrucomicrobiota bacterium]